jgi:hypothetical protein
MKRKVLESDGQQVHQYQHNKQRLSPSLAEHKKGTTTYNIEYQGPGFRQAHKLDGVKTYIKYIFIEM